MRKILIIIWREYLTRVRTKAFIFSTLLTPLGFGLIAIIPAISASNVEKESYKVWVIDHSGFISPKLKDDDFFKFQMTGMTLETQKEILGPKEFVLIIPEIPEHRANPNFSVVANDKLSLQIQKKIIEKGNLIWRKHRMEMREISQEDSEFIKEKPSWSIDEGDGNAGAMVSTIAGTAMSMIIYMMLAIYGSIISRGVIEEKTNRIIELMASTVKPFQLLMGKIIGIGAVGLTQFAIWAIMFMGIVFTASLVLVGTGNLPDPGMTQMPGGSEFTIDPEVFAQIGSVFSLGNIFLFGFYFLGGFMLYGSLFAAVGSAVDQDSETQTLTLPILLPLIIPMMVMSNLIQNPSGMLARVFSIIPFFSPITMMLRQVSSDVPTWELLLSMGLLILSFLGSVWFAGRIYRVGILMYGKKVSFRELWKWVRHY